MVGFDMVLPGRLLANDAISAHGKQQLSSACLSVENYLVFPARFPALVVPPFWHLPHITRLLSRTGC